MESSRLRMRLVDGRPPSQIEIILQHLSLSPLRCAGNILVDSLNSILFGDECPVAASADVNLFASCCCLQPSVSSSINYAISTGLVGLSLLTQCKTEEISPAQSVFSVWCSQEAHIASTTGTPLTTPTTKQGFPRPTQSSGSTASSPAKTTGGASSPLSGGEIAGIVLGGLTLLATIVLLWNQRRTDRWPFG